MLKFAKILVCTILMVAILAVPCFATNEGIYGHYISPGEYRFNAVVTFPENLKFDFFFSSAGSTYSFEGLEFSIRDSNDYMIYYMQADNTGDNIGNVYSSLNGWRDDDLRTIYIDEGFYIYDSDQYYFWIRNLSSVDGYDSALLDEFLSVFVFVGDWVSGAANELVSMFWLDGSLTLVGTLAIASLALAVSFLIIGLISRFLRFRG